MGGHLCEKCGRDFDTAFLLKRHLDRKTPCDAGKARCPGCDLPFADKKAVNAHLKHHRCKGKRPVVIANELQKENETLKDRLQHQQVLLNMTNAVTAAASQADGAPAIVQNNINSNNNITNNFIINLNGLSAVNPVGSESLAHLSGQDIEQKLRLIPGPQVFADWCAILRGDEGNPHNHNVLCLNSDSKEMAVCRKDGWIVDDKSVIMKEILGSDASRLYSAIGSRQEGSSQAQSFKYEYLLHQVMASICNDCNDPSLKPIFEAMAEPIIQLTQKFYVEAVPDNKPPAYVEMENALNSLLLVEEEQQRMTAKRNAAILQIRRSMAQLALQSAVDEP